VSDPGNPVEIGSFDTPGNASDVAIDGNYAYIADTEAGFRILDLSDLRNPAEAASVSAIITSPNGVDVSGNFAYVTDGSLRVFDVSDPGNPVEAGISAGGLFGPQDVSIIGRNAYVADGPGGLQVMDITDPSTPMVVASFDTPGFLLEVAVKNFAYAADTEGGFFIFAIPPPAPTVDPLPRFINADTVTVTGTVNTPGEFVTVGGGELPVFEQLSEGETAFSIEVSLKQEAVNTISVTTMNEFGLVSLPAIRVVVEGVAFPDTVETVTDLAIAPTSATVALSDSLGFSAVATFSDTSAATVTEFVQWEEIANGELVTSGGLYVNTEVGTAQVRANVTGVFSNIATVTDGAKSAKELEGFIAGRVFDQLTGLGVGFPGFDSFVEARPPGSLSVLGLTQVLNPEGNYAFLSPLGNYDVRARADGYRPLTERNQRLDATQSLEIDFDVRRIDFDPPLITFIEPIDGQAVGEPQVGITAIVFDELSELALAELIVNGDVFPLRVEQPQPAISLEGFYRNVWPLDLGVNTIQLRAVDTEGNETLTELLTVNADTTPLELQSAVADLSTEVAVTFNKDVPNDDALLAGRYAIVDSGSLPLAISNAQRLASNQVLLTTANQVPGETYTLSGYGVRDKFDFAMRVTKTVDFVGSAATGADTDGDSMDDGWETMHGLTVGLNDAAGDPDSDTLTNLEEFTLRTDPQNPDTDGDTLTDGAEVDTHATNPFLPDTDLDGMDDGYEVLNGLDPLSDDTFADSDGDGLSNQAEFLRGTSPGIVDTDLDTLSDGDEVNLFGTNPLVQDTDGDGLRDDVELAAGSNPLVDDTVRLALSSPAGGTMVRGNSVTLEATAVAGRPVDVAEVLFQIRPSGVGPFADIVSPVGGEANPVTSRPFTLHWDADALLPGNYDLQVIGTSTAGLVDGAPAVTLLTVDAGASYFEVDAGGVHTLLAPVVQAADNDVVTTDTMGDASVTVMIPATGLTSDTTLEVALMDASGISPILGSREVLTDIVLDVTLLSGQINFANAQVATLQLSYPDVNSDGLLDDSDINESFLQIMFLNPGTNRFEALDNNVVDTIGNTVTAQTSHFSTFALVGVVPPAPLEITTTSPLPQAWEQLSYSQTLSATGGETPLTWSLTVGILPPGLSIVDDAITGTPTLKGIYSFGIRATDSAGPADTDTQAFAINVNEEDFVKPQVVAAIGSDIDRVLITFNEPMADNAALTNASHYTFDNGLTTTGSVTIISPSIIEVGVTNIDQETTYTLTINTTPSGPTDLPGNTIDPTNNTATFTGFIVMPLRGIALLLITTATIIALIGIRKLRTKQI